MSTSDRSGPARRRRHLGRRAAAEQNLRITSATWCPLATASLRHSLIDIAMRRLVRSEH